MPNNPFFVQPASLQGLGQIAQAYGQSELRQEQTAKQQELQKQAQGVFLRGDIQEMSQFMVANPKMAQGIESAFEFSGEQTRKNAADTAFRILKGENADEALRDRAAFTSQQGGDPSGTLSLIGKSPEEQQRIAKITLAQTGTPEQINAISKLGIAGAPAKVGAQEILEDGTIIQSTSAGPVVFGPTGERLKGQPAADAIKVARAEKVSNLRKAAGEKRTATLEADRDLKGEVDAGVISQVEAAKASIKAFDKIESINEKIALYDEGIALIDAGAGSGRIEKMFPSFKTASIKLDNLANRLGLDVVSNTTFGALSAGELAMAMSTALPTALDGPELREWMVEKKGVQEKLADYLESAAIYLGTPGNTKVGWIKKKKLDRARGRQADQTGQDQAPQSAIDFLSANPQAAEQFKDKYGYIPEGS